MIGKEHYMNVAYGNAFLKMTGGVCLIAVSIFIDIDLLFGHDLPQILTTQHLHTLVGTAAETTQDDWLLISMFTLLFVAYGACVFYEGWMLKAKLDSEE